MASFQTATIMTAMIMIVPTIDMLVESQQEVVEGAFFVILVLLFVSTYHIIII